MTFRPAIFLGALLLNVPALVGQEPPVEVAPPSAPPAETVPPATASAPAPSSTPPAPAAPSRIPLVGKLIIAPCTAPVPLGKATLRISGMVRKRGVYTGDYEIKVAPLPFGSEKGRLSVAFTDESLRKLVQGTPVKFNGTATTAGTGKTRAVNGVASPLGKSNGNMQMWFTADGKKKGFASSYRFLEK